MVEIQKVRIDKWLWSIRMYKTRTLASEACAAGRIKIENKSVKASYLLKIGQTIHINKQGEKHILKSKILTEKRIGAALASDCYEDLTPLEEKNKLLFSISLYEKRDKGIGRPTKKNRREIDDFKDSDDKF